MYIQTDTLEDDILSDQNRRIGNRYREGERGEGTPETLNLSSLWTRIRSRLGFERTPDTWMSRRRTFRQEMQERRRWGRRHLRLRTRMLP